MRGDGPAMEAAPSKPSSATLIKSAFLGVLWTILKDLNIWPQAESTRGICAVQSRVYDFLLVPLKLEKLVALSLLVCVDAFLHYITVLPIRLVVGLVRLLLGFITRMRTLNARATVDLITGLLWLSCFAVLNMFETSMMYHYVRTQALIKLYVIFKILDVADKLCTSLGQDIFSSLHSSFSQVADRTPKGSQGLILVCELAIALLYVSFHALIKFVQVTTLHVAINTSDTAVLIILITTNFVEIKGTVFKRVNIQLLMLHTCSDAVERFQLFMFMLLIMWENVSMSSWHEVSSERLEQIAFWVGGVLFCEMVVDWVKHSFVTKLSEMRPAAYDYLRWTLTSHLKSMYTQQATNFHSAADVASIVIGFPGIPFSCLVVRLLRPLYIHVDVTQTYLAMVVMIWASLLLVKLVTSITLAGHSLKHMAKHATAPLY